MGAAKKTSARTKTPAKKVATPAKKVATPAKKPAGPGRKPTPKVSPLRGKSVAWYLDTLAPWQRAAADEIVALVKVAVPAATASLKWGQPVWELGGPIAWLRGAKAHLSFGLWRGAEIEDPKGLLEGDGDRMRHLKLTEGARVPARELGRMVMQAAALNAAKGDPTKGERARGGRARTPS